eukprot:gene54393-43886_t
MPRTPRDGRLSEDEVREYLHYLSGYVTQAKSLRRWLQDQIDEAAEENQRLA